jgi:hypothetical protein
MGMSRRLWTLVVDGRKKCYLDLAKPQGTMNSLE